MFSPSRRKLLICFEGTLSFHCISGVWTRRIYHVHKICPNSTSGHFETSSTQSLEIRKWSPFSTFSTPMSLFFSSYRLFAVFDKFLKYSLIVLPLFSQNKQRFLPLNVTWLCNVFCPTFVEHARVIL